ncbi:MAG: helix-turn-helix domain-containing protein [Planctomycetota bacterium]|nr:helix-turn-helix domain-containing protein [Planctomycetota bacterium]
MSRVSLTQEEKNTLVENLRALRNSRHPGRGGGRKTAKEFGVVPQQWSHWESGKRTPNNSHLKRIADFFGVAPEDLIRPGRFGPTAAPDEPPQRRDLEKGILELMQVFGALSRMQTEVLSGAGDGAKLSAILRDILRYAKFVIAEAGESDPRPLADGTPAGNGKP